MRKIPVQYENPFDNYLLDISDKVTPYVYSSGITPNTITTLSNITTIIVVILLFKSQYYWASFFVLIAYFFDCLDGHLARSHDMVTVFGDYYDHISDSLKTIVVLVCLYIINPEKLLRVLPVIICVILLMFVHIGCQELYYGEDQSPTLNFMKILCPVPSEYSEEQLINAIGSTRLFGIGTVWLTIAATIIYYNY